MKYREKLSQKLHKPEGTRYNGMSHLVYFHPLSYKINGHYEPRFGSPGIVYYL